MVEMKDLIPSKDVRWYLERQGRVLTDFEKATLVYNHSGMNHEEKEKALVDILKMIKDFELQDQIRDRLTHDQFCIAKFYESTEDEIYELSVFSAEDQEWSDCGSFLSGELAVCCGKKFKECFMVDKIKLILEEKEPEECDSECIASLCFTADGKISSYYSNEIKGDSTLGDGSDNRFENAYIEIPHPFKNGDLVRILNGNPQEQNIGIVECLREPEEKHSRQQRYCHYDYSDASLRIAIMSEDAKFGHEHVQITNIEFAALEEDDPRKQLLECAGSLVRGEGGLGDFQFLCNEYCRKRKQENSGGVEE